MVERKQYASLDVAKFIAAILIIVLHTSPLSSYSSIISFGLRDIVTIIAVPFFFITSGFLFCGKLNTLKEKERSEYFKQYIKRLMVMYLFWSAVYFIFVIREWLIEGFEISFVFQYVKEFFVKGSYATIWFLPALITSVAIIYFLHKKLSYKKIFIIGIPFYIIACMGSSYYGLVDDVPVINTLFEVYFSFFETIKNGILFGWVFVALGGVFSEIEIPKKPVRNFILSGIFFVLVAIEAVVQEYLGWATNGVDTKLMLLPLSVFIFMFVLNLNIHTSKVCIWMRKLSLMMFLSQRIFLSLFHIFLSETIFVTNSIVYFIAILISTLAFSIVFIKRSERFKALKKFY